MTGDAATADAVAPESRAVRDRTAAVSWALLVAYALVLVIVSWQRWGVPVNDVGLDLTTAAQWLHGSMPYRDVRYWYGPLGIGVLSGAFAIFGTSLAVAAGVGLAQTALIAELVRRIAGRWLPAPATAATVAAVLSIGFSGTLFNFQLPHTFAATTGLVALLATVLALTRERYVLAGLMIGFAALTRPEFFAFAVAALGGAAFGAVRQHGWREAIVGVVRAAMATLVIAVPVLGFFAAKAGAHRVFLENIFPVQFLKASGNTLEHSQHPFDLPSIGVVLVRGSALVVGVWILLAAWAWLTRDDRGDGRWTDRLPVGPAKLAIWVGGALVAGLVLAAAGGSAGAPFSSTKSDITRLIIGTTSLPGVAFAALIAAAVAWVRRGPAPLVDPPADVAAARAAIRDETAAGQGAAAREDAPGWVAGGALVAVAAACSLRSYGGLSTDFYGTYYAAPVVILLAAGVFRIARGLGRRRGLATATVMVAVAFTLSVHAVLGLYRDDRSVVHAPAGTFRVPVDSGPAIQGVLNLLAPQVRPGERILSLPQEPGFVFLLKGRPALYDSTFLPGTLATRVEDGAAAHDLIDGGPSATPTDGPYTPPRFVIEAVWNFAPWGFKAEGVDVNARLHRAITQHYKVIGRFGDTSVLPPEHTVGRAFTVYEYAGGVPTR